MTSDSSHPAAGMVLGALPAERLATVAVCERDEVVAVVVQNDSVRYVVLVEWREKEWVVPSLINGTGRPATRPPRPATTQDPVTLPELTFTQPGWPAPDGDRPEFAWCAVTGVAARDAREVVLTSEVDEVCTAVRSDGFVLGVVKARWHIRPEVAVRTSAGHLVVDRRPS